VPPAGDKLGADGAEFLSSEHRDQQPPAAPLESSTPSQAAGAPAQGSGNPPEAIVALDRTVLARRDLSRRWDAVRNSDLLELMVLTVPPLLGAERCGLFVLDPEAGEIWMEAGSDVVQRQICVAP